MDEIVWMMLVALGACTAYHIVQLRAVRRLLRELRQMRDAPMIAVPSLGLTGAPPVPTGEAPGRERRSRAWHLTDAQEAAVEARREEDALVRRLRTRSALP